MTTRLAQAMVAAALGLALLGQPTLAGEPQGCDGFKWPLKTEAGLLQSTTKPIVVSGTTAPVDGKALELQLLDFGGAALPKTPERTPKIQPSTAGYLNVEAPSKAGSYQITVSAAAWLDVIQDGKFIKPSAFSGATGCPGVRKSIRVDLTANPFTLQISGLPDKSIGIVITPAPQ